MTVQFSRASASAIAAMSASEIARRGSAISAACKVRFDRAGLRRRREFGPRQIDFEEFVGDQQPAAVVMVEQMMAAGQPEILHFRSPCARPTRST